MIKSTKSKALISARIALTERLAKLEMEAQILSAKIRRVLRTAELLDKKVNSIVESNAGEKAFNSYLAAVGQAEEFVWQTSRQIDMVIEAAVMYRAKSLASIKQDEEDAVDESASDGGNDE